MLPTLTALMKSTVVMGGGRGAQCHTVAMGGWGTQCHTVAMGGRRGRISSAPTMDRRSMVATMYDGCYNALQYGIV